MARTDVPGSDPGPWPEATEETWNSPLEPLPGHSVSDNGTWPGQRAGVRPRNSAPGSDPGPRLEGTVVTGTHANSRGCYFFGESCTSAAVMTPASPRSAAGLV